MKIRDKKIRPALLIAGAVLAAALAAVWRSVEPEAGAAGRVMAVCSAAMFAVLAARFGIVLAEDWRGRRRGETVPSLHEPVRPAVLAEVFFACMAAELAAMALTYVLYILAEGWADLRTAMEVWTYLDARHYMDIARDWYLSEGDRSRVVQLVFLPGYPLAMRLAARLTGEYLWAGLLVSVLSFSGAGVVLYSLARLDMDHAAALRTLKYAVILPGAIFFAGPMSESLFFLLSLSCVYLARRGRWLPACLLGGLAAFTRSLGVVLAVPVGYELLADALDRRPRGWERKAAIRRALDFLCLFLIPAGFGAYCLICRDVSGDPFKFLEYQREHWNQTLGPFFATAAYQTEYAVRSFRARDYMTLMGLWLPNLLCTLIALPVMAAAARRLRPSCTAYFIAYYAVAVGASWLLSGPRYLAALFPLSMALASLTEDRRADDAATVALSAFYVLYGYMLVDRWQVW